jgi:hypothetical protein
VAGLRGCLGVSRWWAPCESFERGPSQCTAEAVRRENAMHLRRWHRVGIILSVAWAIGGAVWATGENWKMSTEARLSKRTGQSPAARRMDPLLGIPSERPQA